MSLTISLPQIEEALERAEGEAREAERRASALRKIAEGLRDLNGHASNILDVPPTPPVFLPLEPITHPRGREAIRLIAAERSGPWPLGELVAELDRRGWTSTRKAVEVAVHRLRQSGEARRVGTGVYEFSVQQKEGAGESDPSDGAMIPLRT